MPLKTFCTSIYCNCLWCSFNKSTMKKLNVMYNNAFRRLHRLDMHCNASVMFVYSSCNIPSCSELRRKNISSFVCRLCLCDNSNLRSIVYTDVPMSSLIWTFWYRSLFQKYILKIKTLSFTGTFMQIFGLCIMDILCQK